MRHPRHVQHLQVFLKNFHENTRNLKQIIQNHISRAYINPEQLQNLPRELPSHKTQNTSNETHNPTHHLPIDGLEERVRHDLDEGVGTPAAAEPLGGLLAQEALEDRGRLDRQRARYAYRLLQDHLEQVVLGVLVGVLRGAGDVEGRAAGEHLVQENTEGPPVDGEAVVLAAQDLRGYVVGGAAERGGGVALAHALLAHAVVGQLDVALVVQEDVVELEVAVDYSCGPGIED